MDENENSSLQKPMDRCRSPKLPLYTIFQLSSTRYLSNYFLTNKQTHTQQLNSAFKRERERETTNKRSFYTDFQMNPNEYEDIIQFTREEKYPEAALRSDKIEL